METVRISQGKITTQNELLLAMLREKTMENKQISRVYVDSPIFSDEDENKYKFISTDPEDLDFQQTERHPPSNRNHVDPSRYEDMNSRGSKRGLQQRQEYDTEYIVRSANANRSYASPVKALTPIKTVSQRDEESQDDEELRQEEEYQRALQQKIRHQQEESKNIHIPRLPLDNSDDGDDRGVADSLDYTVPEEQPGYNDSLEEEEEEETEEEVYTQNDKERVSRIMKDSLDDSAYEEPKKKPFTRFAPSTSDNRDSNRGRIQTPHNSNRGKEKLDQMFQQSQYEDQRDPQYSQDPRYKQEVEQPKREYPVAKTYQPPQEQYQAPPQQPQPQQYQAPPQQYQAPPQQYQAPPQQYQAPPQQYQAPPQQYQAPPQQYQAPPQQYQAPPQQYQAPPPQQYQPPPQQFQPPPQYQQPPISDQFGEYPQEQYENGYNSNENYDEGQGQDPGYNSYPSQQQEDYQQYEQNQNSDEYYESDQASQDQLQMSPGRQRKQVDYLSLNKEHLRTGRGQQSYGKILKTKKEIKENLPFIDVSHRVGKNKPPLPNKKTPQPALQKPLVDPNRNMSGPPPAGPPPVAPVSAESVWEKRSHILAAKKSGGKKPKRTLQKYPSESRVNTMHNEQRKQGFQSSPMQPQHSMTEPIRSEVTGSKPVTHTVYTDDGQRVSVDINLKVVSPQALKPLGPGAGTRPMGGGQQQPLLQQQQQQQRPMQPSPRQQAPQGSYRPTMQKQQQFYEDFQPKAQYRPAMQPPMRPMPQQHMPEDPQYLEQRNQAMEGEYKMLEQQYRGGPPQQPQQNYHQMPSSQQQQLQLQQQQHHYQQQQQQQQQQFQMHQAPQMPSMGPGMAHPMQTEPDYGHPREGWTSPHSGADMNPEAPGSPYKVLPPIGSADTDQGRNPHYGEYDTSPTRDDQGSYAAAFKNKKTKKPPEYKSYTLGDYRKMKKEVKLGGLGPDLDSETHKEKKEKIMKQQEYAKMINQRNREAKAAKKTKEREEPTSADILTKRKVALEYAKNVPKPKVQEKSSSASVGHGSQPALSVYQGSPRSVSENSGQVSNREQDAEIINLQILQQRHEQERQQAALIRQNISGVSGTA